MEDLLQFLGNFEIWIYILLGVVGIVYFRKLFLAWQEWRNSLFGLERESSQRKLSAALAMVVLLTLLATSEFIMVSFVAPSYPGGKLVPTATLNLLVTPTTTLPSGQSDAPIVTTPTGASGVPAAAISPQSSDGCKPKLFEWIAPTNGEKIKGAYELKATVNFDNLGFFKYEYSQPGSNNWITIAAGNEKKVDQVLGTWNTEQLTPGDYILRLVVTDNQNQVPPACQVSVQIVAP
jgi:hypothetical protein